MNGIKCITEYDQTVEEHEYVLKISYMVWKSYINIESSNLLSSFQFDVRQLVGDVIGSGPVDVMRMEHHFSVWHDMDNHEISRVVKVKFMPGTDAEELLFAMKVK